MKDQRWPGDYQTVREEFTYSRIQEQMGLNDVNESFSHDYLARGIDPRLDEYQKSELEPSWSIQLDTVGMQPHAREYLERQIHCERSERKFEMIEGQSIDYPAGIQFSGKP